MKRGDAEVAPVHLEWVRRTLQWGSSRRHQALSQGGRALPCFVKMNLPQRQAVWFQPCCRVHWARPTLQCLGGASLWAAVCGPDGVWPCGGAWPREMRVEGRRRPKMAVVASRQPLYMWQCNLTFWCCINSATCDPLTNSIMKGIARLKKWLAHPSLLPLSSEQRVLCGKI